MKILVIRFSSIGDIVLTSPIVRCLKLQLPEAEIHFLTKEAFAGLVNNNINIDKVHVLKNTLQEVMPQLKSENFDIIIDLHKNLRTLIVKIFLNKKTYTFKKLNFEKWLLVNFKINRLPDIHIVDRYFATVKNLNVYNDNKGLDFFIPEDECIGYNELPLNFQSGYVVLVIGGKHFTKQIPDNMLIELCRTTEIPIIMIGGKEDRERAENIRRISENRDVFNACGSFNINQSASVIEQSKLVITPDTGMMHIASAFKKKIVSVWGNTVTQFGMFPYLPEGNKAEIIEVNGLKCRPCSKIGFNACPKKHFDCMNKNDISKIKKFLINDR